MRICSVAGCGRNLHCRGLCSRHYQALLKYGDPTVAVLRKGQRLLVDLMRVDCPECIPWPFGTTKHGYGVTSFKGKYTTASRAVCAMENGPPPTDRHEAAHSCGNGHLGCVNRHHLSWKLPVDNQADRIVHGTLLFGEMHQNAKLTEAAVREIRREHASVSKKVLAARYGVTSSTIGSAISRKTWRHVL